MTRGIWVFLEHEGGKLESVSLELLGKGRELADAAGEPLVGLILGASTAPLAAEAARYNVDEIITIEHPLLEPYTTDPCVQAVHRALAQQQPNILLLGATPNGRDLAGRLAVRVRTGLTADCTALEIKREENGAILLCEVTGFGGGIAAIIACKTRRPQMATVRPGVFPPPQAGESRKDTRITKIEISVHPETVRTKVLERKLESQGDLTRAKRLVVGGAGVHGKFELIEQLAQAIGAEVGATRVAVDHGWISKEAMVGQTGYVTRPKIAIACGVSGALQFMVGIQNAEIVVAINNDPEAPIFEQADYCITEDLFQILPSLIEELSGAPAGKTESVNCESNADRTCTAP
jgi:electron transfer flavoprotein alpha subunit